MDVFAIDTVYLRFVAYNWKHIKGEGLDAVEHIIVFHRRMFNEISVTWNALHANSKQPRLAGYLLNMLEAMTEEKRRFDKEWDAHVIPVIETVKLVKHGKRT